MTTSTWLPAGNSQGGCCKSVRHTIFLIKHTHVRVCLWSIPVFFAQHFDLFTYVLQSCFTSRQQSYDYYCPIFREVIVGNVGKTNRWQVPPPPPPPPPRNKTKRPQPLWAYFLRLTANIAVYPYQSSMIWELISFYKSVISVLNESLSEE